VAIVSNVRFLGFTLLQTVFFGHRPNFFRNDRNKLSQFSHNVRKGRLANTLSASFDTITGQITEVFQRKKQLTGRINLSVKHLTYVVICFRQFSKHISVEISVILIDTFQ